MGIPGYFSNCIKEYNKKDDPRSIIKKIIPEFKELDDGSIVQLSNRLFLDFNCAIYYVIKPEMKTEETLITYVLEYLDSLCSMINNLELIYIAIDGVPPRAKMEQQRARRFHSICKKKKSEIINSKYGSVIDKTVYNTNYDTNMITPGTEFMSKLSDAIKAHISRSEIYKNKKIIFSNSNVPLEGEHKILEYIKLNPSKNDQNTIIYGLDGDLIMLSLVSKEDDIYLLREAKEYGSYALIHNNNPYLYMDINNLRYALMNSFKVYNPNIDINNTQRYIDDYIFLSFMLGNDFVHKWHWFSIYEGGYKKILSAYFQVHINYGEFLIDRDKMNINTLILVDIFDILKESETYSVKKFMEKRQRSRIPVSTDMSERERRQVLTDFYPLQYLHIEEEIEPNKPKWRNRYYKKCFNMVGNPENIKLITDSYLKTLVWNFKYYFEGCTNWSHFYPYGYSPTVSDLYYALSNIKNLNTEYKFSKDKPITQQTLLLMVLPEASRGLMARNYSSKLFDNKCNLNIYFPNRYIINVIFNRYYHECLPIIPRIEITLINDFIKNLKLSSKEESRNKFEKEFILN